MKKVLIIRYGGLGDAIMLTPLLNVLKEDGYHITVNTTEDPKQVLNHNPNIDTFMVHGGEKEVANKDLGKHWEKISKGFDKVINLSGSVEDSLLKVEGSRSFLWDKATRHKHCNKNYYDETLRLGGYGHITGRNGELYFSRLEEKLARNYRRKYKNKFLILWSLSGSSFHKTYPYAEIVANLILDKYPDIMTLTVGDMLCELLEWRHGQAKSYSGKWPIRKSLIMTKYVDLVIGTETGILNAAGCFDTPKIIMLSHSSEENLSKYWGNCASLNANVKCYPCHQLHYSLESCPVDHRMKAPVCMANLKGLSVFDEIERVYFNWKKKRRLKKTG